MLYQRIFPPLPASLAFPESEKPEKVPGDDPCEDVAVLWVAKADR